MLVFPGDHVRVPSTSAVKLGPGLAIASEVRQASKNSAATRRPQRQLVATVPGVLGELQSAKARGKSREAGTAVAAAAASAQETAYWVESNGARYIPSVHDHVLCQITARGAEAYQVTLMSSFTPANLPALSFEGATKRNKPNLRVGTLLYAHVVSASRHAEIELSCVDPATGKSAGFGELKTERTSDTAGQPGRAAGAGAEAAESVAMLWPVSCGLARSLLNPSHQLLARLASHFPFEVAIGVNGYVWVRAQNPRHVIAVGKVLEQADATARAGDLASSSSSSSSTDGLVQPKRAAAFESLDALQVGKQRGSLDPTTIARTVEPFK